MSCKGLFKGKKKGKSSQTPRSSGDGELAGEDEAKSSIASPSICPPSTEEKSPTTVTENSLAKTLSTKEASPLANGNPAAILTPTEGDLATTTNENPPTMSDTKQTVSDSNSFNEPLDFLGKAIDVVKRATDEDGKGNFDEAYGYYASSLEYFMYAISYEKNERSKESIRKMFTKYLERAEQLKEYIQRQRGGTKSPLTRNADTNKMENDEFEDEEAETARTRKDLAGLILQDKRKIEWDDVAGLEEAKRVLEEALVCIRFGRPLPCKSILLYGPPGTGKTYLANAFATRGNLSFFSVDTWDLVGRHNEESERQVKEVFRLAREDTPAVVVLDSVDSLCRQQGDGAIRAQSIIREMSLQMSGGANAKAGVVVLGTTNVPWQLDSAVRQLFEKRVYTSLPDDRAREYMFHLNLGRMPCRMTQQDFKELAMRTEGFSGSDIGSVVRDSLMEPVRKVQMATHFRQAMAPSRKNPSEVTAHWTPCSPDAPSAVEKSWAQIEADEVLEPELIMNDVVRALSKADASVDLKNIRKHEQWTNEFGQAG